MCFSDSDQSERSGSPDRDQTNISQSVSQRQSPRKGKGNTASPSRRQQASQPTTSKNMKPAAAQKAGKSKDAAKARQPNASPTRSNPQARTKSPARKNPPARTKSPARINLPARPNVPSKQKPVLKASGAARRKQKPPVLRDIQRLQTNTDCQIPKAPFGRLVREIIQRNEARGEHLRLTVATLEALRESAENYVTQVFTDANHITINRQRVTLVPRDIQLLMFLRGPSAGGPANFS